MIKFIELSIYIFEFVTVVSYIVHHNNVTDGSSHPVNDALTLSKTESDLVHNILKFPHYYFLGFCKWYLLELK